MICPQCGYDIGNKHKCIRCGYEVKNLVVSDGTRKNEDRPQTKVIDPDKVYISNGDEDDFVDPFDMLFGNIFDPIDSLLGGLFGINMHTHRVGSFDSAGDEEEDVDAHGKKSGEGKVVEVNKVEILDDNGNPINQHKSTHTNKSKNKDRHKK